MPFSSMGGAGGPGGAGGGGYGYPPLGSAVAPLRPFVFAPALAASAPPAFPILSDAESRAIEQSATKAFWASCGAVPRLKERMSELKTSLRAIVAFETDPTFRLFPIIWVTATATSLNDILSNERLVPSKSQLETIARDFDSVVTQIAAGVFPESNDYAHEVKPHVDRAISLLGEIQKALDTEIQMQTDAALAERLSAIEL
jgi:hypothetical protein